MTSPNPKVLLFSTQKQSFIEDDVRLLEEFSDVKWICAHGFFTAVRIKWSMLFSDVGIAWFASVYSTILVFTARFLRKTSIIIVGGADLITDSHLGYGLLLSPWKRPFIRYALRRATHVLPTSEHLRRAALEVGEYEGDNLSTVPPGLDSNFWQPGDQKENIILTVARCTTKDRILIKGIDLLFQVAEEMSDISFQILGVEENLLSRNDFVVPKNVIVSPSMSQEKLLNYYQRSAVYCQLSRVESFGIATAEAMLCGCVPVVTDVGGLPEVIGDSGLLVSPDKPETFASTLREALASSASMGKNARERIVSNFPLQNRQAELKRLITK
ncbi:MAG: glycosyltransferase family 4 protein [Candidatus Marinimicrobia bacterium]|nr:glycosyltransferase family 4 protein [Candidatus Neomarinimicrobiota bacterium]